MEPARQVSNRVQAGQIGRQEGGLGAGGDGRHLVQSSGSASDVARGHDDLGAARRQLSSGGKADAAAGAGDQDSAADDRLWIAGHGVHDQPEAGPVRGYSLMGIIPLSDDRHKASNQDLADFPSFSSADAIKRRIMSARTSRSAGLRGPKNSSAAASKALAARFWTARPLGVNWME